MTSENPAFEQLESVAEQSGIAEAIEYLIQHFRRAGEYHQLFEALKLKVRFDLGLPLLYGESPDPIDDQRQRRLEDGLLAACREVGTELLKAGNLQEGWMYLQPLADRELIRELVTGVEVTDDNRDALIDIGLSQRAAPELGYRLLLETYGTCNAITTFDTQIMHFERPLQKQLAALLVDHLYRELVANVRGHIEKQESQRPESFSLRELTSRRAWLFANGGHHVDTTHLASIMRIGRIVDQVTRLQQLLELAEYGQQLAADFQYAGSPPFENTYPDHVIFYRSLLGLDVEQAIRHFADKIPTTERSQYGLIAVETVVDLLSRTGNRQQALDLAIEQLLGQQDLTGLAPHVFEIAASPAEFRKLMEHYREQEDLLGFSIGLLKTKTID
jgi:hypothetical protein